MTEAIRCLALYQSAMQESINYISINCSCIWKSKTAASPNEEPVDVFQYFETFNAAMLR